nr:serine/threonine-protein kinase [Rhodopirellula sp. SM50]
MSIDAKPSSVRKLYLQAVRMEEDSARKAFLTEACGDDIELRQRVEKLLDARAADRDNVLQRATADSMSGRSSFSWDGADLGETSQSHPEAVEDDQTRHDAIRGLIDVSTHPMIGNYRLLEELGHGGMGTVYMAQQTKPVKRQVALKVIKPGMDSKEVIARFEAERQALAMMDHPHIARVLDGGTTDEGRPYFVMELVRGVPITKFCKRKSLPLRQRLELFVDICHAVQHAHQKGIIHRDLKPSNIMVTLHDGKPVVKVIDFGVAKALHQELTERTLFTQFAQMVGTPLYMAPEQAEMSGLGVDTRSDIYSLGVVLYELLTGTTPFDRDTMSKLGINGIRKLIQEQEPQRPSARISTLKAANRSTIEDQRQLDTEDIANQLHREVDWIVMKALEKDRERRYETANAFAADIQRFLNDEPVEACPPSMAYLLRKRVRKYRIALTTVTAVALALVIGSGLSLWQARVANAERAKANTQQELANASFDKSLEAVDSLLERVASESLASTPELTQVRRKLYDDAIRFYDELAGIRPDDVRVPVRKASTQTLAASLSTSQSDYVAAKEYLHGAEGALRSLHTTHPKDRTIRRQLARCLEIKGFMLMQTRYGSDAVEARREAFGLVDPDLEPLEYCWTLVPLCQVLFYTGERDESFSLLRENMPIIDTLYDSGHSEYEVWHLTQRAYITLCGLYVGREEYEKALQAGNTSLEISKRALSQNSNHPQALSSLLRSLIRLGEIYERLSEFETALDKFEASLTLSTEHVRMYPTLKEDYWSGLAASGIARMLIKLGRTQELQSRLQEMQPQTGMDHYVRSQMFEELGDETKMAESLKLAIALDDTLVWTRRQLAEFYYRNADYEQALKHLPVAAKNFGHLRKRLAHAHFEVGQYDQAIEIFKRTIEESPEEIWTLVWIPLDRLAACHDSRFRRAYLRRHDQMIEARPRDPDVYAARALTKLAFGQTDAALEDVRQCVQVWERFGERSSDEKRPTGVLAVASSLVSRAGVFCAGKELDSEAEELFSQGIALAKRLDKESLGRAYSPFYYCVLTNVASDDVDTAAERVAEMIRLLGERNHPTTQHFIVWSASLAPGLVDDYQAPIALARRGVENDPDNQQYLNGLGAILMRAGYYDEAKQQLQKALQAGDTDNTSSSYIHYFLAMTEHHLGNIEAAQEHLNKANESAEEELANDPAWNRRLTLKLLRKEAESQITPAENGPNVKSNE